ncbi:MAG: hypothetical protein Q8O94_02825 [bacterium]|nr:hypothetical protein [bacterium]
MKLDESKGILRDMMLSDTLINLADIDVAVFAPFFNDEQSERWLLQKLNNAGMCAADVNQFLHKARQTLYPEPSFEWHEDTSEHGPLLKMTSLGTTWIILAVEKSDPQTWQFYKEIGDQITFLDEATFASIAGCGFSSPVDMFKRSAETYANNAVLAIQEEKRAKVRTLERMAANSPLVKEIQDAIRNGIYIAFRTRTKGLQIASPDHIRVANDGFVRVLRGYNRRQKPLWDEIDTTAMNQMLALARGDARSRENPYTTRSMSKFKSEEAAKKDAANKLGLQESELESAHQWRFEYGKKPKRKPKPEPKVPSKRDAKLWKAVEATPGQAHIARRIGLDSSSFAGRRPVPLNIVLNKPLIDIVESLFKATAKDHSRFNMALEDVVLEIRRGSNKTDCMFFATDGRSLVSYSFAIVEALVPFEKIQIGISRSMFDDHMKGKRFIRLVSVSIGASQPMVDIETPDGIASIPIPDAFYPDISRVGFQEKGVVFESSVKTISVILYQYSQHLKKMREKWKNLNPDSLTHDQKQQEEKDVLPGEFLGLHDQMKDDFKDSNIKIPVVLDGTRNLAAFVYQQFPTKTATSESKVDWYPLACVTKIVKIIEKNNKKGAIELSTDDTIESPLVLISPRWGSSHGRFMAMVMSFPHKEESDDVPRSNPRSLSLFRR